MSKRPTIFITGAASGIGRATAQHFAKHGWFVGLFDIDEGGLNSLSGSIGDGNSMSRHLDIRNQQQWSEAVTAFCERTDGRMNVLLNNAGIGHSGWFEDIAIADSLNLIDINLAGTIRGIYSCLEALQATPAARVINMSSVAGCYGIPRISVYSATKHGVRALTESLNEEFRRHDISVCDIMPWFVDTAAVSKLETPKSEIEAMGITVYPVELAAQRVWQAAHGKKIHYTVGAMAAKSQFLSYYLPGMMRRMVRNLLVPPNERL